MTNHYKCHPNMHLEEQTSPRAMQLNIFYFLKTNHSFISRYQLYLAIAILDKYLLKHPYAHPNTITHQNMGVRAAASLLIACKFIETHHVPLSQFSVTVDYEMNLREQIIEMQGQILQGIDFEVPIDFAYAAMTRAFQSLKKEDSDEKVIVSQCLAFLKQALLYSNTFSLSPQLGTQIVGLIVLKISKDCLIKEICHWIRNKSKEQRRVQNKVAQPLLSK